MRDTSRRKTTRRTSLQVFAVGDIASQMPGGALKAPPQALRTRQVSYLEKIIPQPLTRLVSTPATFRLFHTVVDTVS